MYIYICQDGVILTITNLTVGPAGPVPIFDPRMIQLLCFGTKDWSDHVKLVPYLESDKSIINY